MAKYDDLKKKFKINPLESGLRGAAESLSMGASDEIAGGLGALKDRIMSGVPLSQGYQQNVDESRAAYQAAKEQNPNAYTVGEIGGGLASLAIPGMNIAKGAKTAAALGALSGLARADTEDSAKLAKAALLGGTLGMAGGEALRQVGPRFKTLAQKLGIAKSNQVRLPVEPMTEEKLRRSVNPELYEFQTSNKIPEVIKQKDQILTSEIADFAKKEQEKELLKQAQERRFDTLEDYLNSASESTKKIKR